MGRNHSTEHQAFWAAVIAGGMLAGVGAGCGSVVSESEPTFAHRTGPGLMGTPMALMGLRQRSLLANGRPSICIDNRSATLSDDAATLEVKLAFAAWWQASGSDPAQWGQIAFSSGNDCARDASHLAVVVIPSADGQGLKAEDQALGFVKPQYSCSASASGSGSAISCQTNTMTLGWGSPASVRFTRGGDGALLTVEIMQAGRALMSSHVSWQPLTKVLGPDRVQRLKDVGAGELSALAALVDEMARSKLTGSKDPVFQKAIDDFARSGKDRVVDVPYRPELLLYSTLLHEVGHIFGMDHADNPAADSVTGFANGTKVGDGQQAKTDLAVMAYALPYLYLTEDDRAGAQSVARAARQF